MTGIRHKTLTGIGDWVGRWIEARTIGGGVYRGKLHGVVESMLVIEKHDGRDVLLPVDRLVAVLDEESPVAMSRDERDDQDEEVTP